ncbi:MAG: DUF3159 domain-containing protein [Anaerolineae bacterium]|nr:DUF3159 domain-containing protein [Anaerolineae bacterium]
MGAKLRELLEEFRAVVGAGRLLDALLPPLVFVLANALLGLTWATAIALALGLATMVWRLARRQRWTYALAGLGSALLAAGLAYGLGRAEAYFLPGLLNGALTTLVALLSVAVGRPLVALTSFLARRWPLAWYWHPQVRPAYNEVTLAWALFFALRLALQYVALQRENAGLVGLVHIVGGWPATVALLALSYLYGTWRLRRLGGPSVEEFGADAPPPWEGQRRGF